MTKHLFLAGLACGAAAGPLAAAPADEREVASSVASFVDAVNTGRRAEALLHFTADLSIVEGIAPYRWQGPAAGAALSSTPASSACRRGPSSAARPRRSPARRSAS
jgi:hypothetical protein